MVAGRSSAGPVALVAQPAAHGPPAEGLFALAREVAYAPIAGQSLADQTAKRLTDLVALGIVDVGELLPSEQELAERLGVSGATLREALAELRGAGLIATKRGRGGGSMVMREVPPPTPDQARRLLAERSFDELRDLGDYRLAVEGRAAALAAQRATPAEVEALEAILEEMGAAASFASYRRLDARLHIGVAGASRSTWLIAGVTTVQAQLGDFLSLLQSSAARMRLTQDQYADLLRAVRDRDSAAAGEAAEQHVRTVTALLIDARSELAHAHSDRTTDYFAGLRPYGSELGAVPLDLVSEDASLPARRGARTPRRR